MRPSTTVASDDEPTARRKAPDTFIAALIRLIAEISKRAAEKGMPFNVTEMPGTKADFRALAIKFDDKLEKAPRTFDDYLAGLLRFKQGARETTFYKELFPEFFAPRRSDPEEDHGQGRPSCVVTLARISVAARRPWTGRL